MPNQPPICLEDDHDYTVINIRQMNGHQTPIVVCERCDTAWHSYTPAHRGDLILIPGHERPDPEHLAAISELSEKTGVMFLFAEPGPLYALPASSAKHPAPAEDQTSTELGASVVASEGKSDQTADVIPVTKEALELLCAQERHRIRAAIRVEIDDLDPDGRMRQLAQDQTREGGDPGLAGNSWWRAYCHVGGLMVALACTEPDSASTGSPCPSSAKPPTPPSTPASSNSTITSRPTAPDATRSSGTPSQQPWTP